MSPSLLIWLISFFFLASLLLYLAFTEFVAYVQVDPEADERG